MPNLNFDKKQYLSENNHLNLPIFLQIKAN
jgi:hypothetical protein